jgi:hypothetical protein
MEEEKDNPVWFPENPYKTDEDWHRKSECERVYQMAMWDILDAYLEYEKRLKQKKIP